MSVLSPDRQSSGRLDSMISAASPAHDTQKLSALQKLQKAGLDLLSSIHWIVFVVIGVLFAGVVALFKHRKAVRETREMELSADLVAQGRDQLEQIYFPNGKLNTSLFRVDEAAVANSHSDPAAKVTYADDAINRKLNSTHSGSLFKQLSGYVRTGKMFSFVNSLADTGSNIQAKLAEQTKPAELSERQKHHMNMHRAHVGDPLRNPFLRAQINKDWEEKQREKASRQGQEQHSAPACNLSPTTAATQPNEAAAPTIVYTPQEIDQLNAVF